MKLCKLISDNKGSVIIELAIFISIVASLAYGYIAIMGGIKTDVALQAAAREGAREYASTLNSNLGISKAEEELKLLKVNGATISPAVSGHAKGILITKDYTYKIPLFGAYTKHLKGICYFYEE